MGQPGEDEGEREGEREGDTLNREAGSVCHIRTGGLYGIWEAFCAALSAARTPRPSD